jgi:hypothetical protein
MPRIACLMMLRDEALLLRPWLIYHGYLFGLENLYDNGSASAEVLAILRQFQAVGVNVDFSRNQQHDFAGKGGIIGGKIKEFKAAGSYDIAFAVDCDEFIALAGPAGPSISRNQILAEIERIDQAGLICQTEKCFYNVPGHLDQFWLAGHRKCIVPVRLFKEIDHGFHWVNKDDSAQYGVTQLTYIHLHHKPFAQAVAGAKQKLGAFTDITDLEGLKSYRGVGWHLVKYLFMTAAAYYQLRPEGLPFIKYTGFLRLLTLLTGGAIRDAWEAARPETTQGNPAMLDLDETPFSAAAYLAANMDLKAVPNLFYHYIEAGLAAGRPMGPAETPREDALRAMREGRHAEAIAFWAKFRARFPQEPEGYDYAVIACRNAGVDPADIITEARARFPDFFSLLMSPT